MLSNEALADELSPVELDEKTTRQLERLGNLVLKFGIAADRIYRRSRKGSVTPWIASLVDEHDSERSLICPTVRISETGITVTSLTSPESQSALCSPLNPLWMALLHTPSLSHLWAEEMRHSHLERLQQVINYAWVIDPSPLPISAELPRLGCRTWPEVAQRNPNREGLVISGAGETVLRAECTEQQWQDAITRAVESFPKTPYLMQELDLSSSEFYPRYEVHEGQAILVRSSQ